MTSFQILMFAVVSLFCDNASSNGTFQNGLLVPASRTVRAAATAAYEAANTKTAITAAKNRAADTPESAANNTKKAQVAKLVIERHVTGRPNDNLTVTDLYSVKETGHDNVRETDHDNVTDAEHDNVTEADHDNVTEADHDNVTETDHDKATLTHHADVLDFLKFFVETSKNSQRSVAKLRRTRDTDQLGSHLPNINGKLHELEHCNDEPGHKVCGGHGGSNTSKSATYVTDASDGLTASPRSEQGITSRSLMSPSTSLTPGARDPSSMLEYSVNVYMRASPTTLSAAAVQDKVPNSAEPFSSSHIDSIRAILKCSAPILTDCLSSVAMVTTSIDLTPHEEQSLMTSLDFLLDELVTIGLTRETANVYNDLREFTQILNVNIHLCGLVGSRCDEQRLNTLLAKAEDFLELVMTSNLSSQLKGRSSFSFNHLDLVMVKTAYGSIRGRTLYMKSGEITIEDIAPKSGFSNSAKTFVSALIMHLPRSKVTLVKDSLDQISAAVVSPVLSLKAYVEWSRVSISHTFILPATSLENDTDVPICGFQRNGYNGSQDLWDTTGCSVVDMDRNMFEALSKPFTNILDSQTMNDTPSRQPRYVGCFCNHTTNFAILMQIVDFEVSDSDDLALSIITYIGCSVTMITQVMAITVFTCIRSLNSERVCVHRNLCITILAAQVTFISGVNAVEDKVLCAIVAVALHYLYSATFVWMLVEGLHLYNKVVKVFGTEKSRIIYYIFFGWGIPLILVAISAAVDWEGYGNSRSCWLSIQRRTIWAFVGPAAAIIIVNLVILLLVLRIVVTSATVDKQDNHAHIR